jgi:Ca2+-binding EF-hand superfamily protein
LLQGLDANHDGKISADEFRAPQLAKFNRVDANHDGVATVQEQQAAGGGK